MVEMFGVTLFDPVRNTFNGCDPWFIAAVEKIVAAVTEHGVAGGDFLQRTAASITPGPVGSHPAV